MLDLRWFLGVVVVGTLSPALAARALSCTASLASGVEQALRAVVGGEPVPAGFSVTYTDLHPFHGGLSLSIGADGQVERRAVREKAGQPKQVTPYEWRTLAALMVRQKLWQQRTPERPPGNDESRASLILSCGSQVSTVWEWYNDLEKNGRMIRVREAMKKVAWTP